MVPRHFVPWLEVATVMLCWLPGACRVDKIVREVHAQDVMCLCPLDRQRKGDIRVSAQ